MQQLTEEGIEFLKEQEGCSLEAYQDTKGIWTIGYGFTGNVKPTDVITQEEAEERLITKITPIEISISHLVIVALNDNEFSALVSLTYNIGVHAFGTSTLLKHLNEGLKQDAADQFLVWDKPIEIMRRRHREMDLFLKPFA